MRKIITGTQSLPPASADQPLSAPAAERNIEPILGVLRQHMPPAGLVVEIASGTGQHCARFAVEFPGVTWSPTDPSPERLVSISAWAAASGQANIQRPIALDAGEPGWPFEAVSLDGLVAINLLHIAGDHVATQVFASAGQLLKPGGHFFLYGPFTRDGEFVSEGDRAFHQQLVGMDAAIGYKDVRTVEALAAQNGLAVKERHDMPANNLLFVIERLA
jgi:SAM-dependent methyltransferase